MTLYFRSMREVALALGLGFSSGSFFFNIGSFFFNKCTKKFEILN